MWVLKIKLNELVTFYNTHSEEILFITPSYSLPSQHFTLNQKGGLIELSYNVGGTEYPNETSHVH